jgi:multisubunit Na+/H+ antiporter MnhB subunit
VNCRRCPSCRTFVEEKDLRCFACRGDLSTAGPVAPLRRPQLLQTTRRDKTASSALLVVLAIFGFLGVSMLALNPGVALPARIGIGAILILSFVFGVIVPAGQGGESVRRPILKVFAAIGLVVVAAVAAVFALVMVLFVACATGAGKW